MLTWEDIFSLGNYILMYLGQEGRIASCNFLTSDLFLFFQRFYGAENLQNKKLEEIKTNLRTPVVCTGVPSENVNERSMGTTR